MPDKPINELLAEELAKITLPDGIELDVITSKQLVDRIIPLMTVFSQTQIQEAQKVKDKTGESLAALATNIITSPGDLPSITGIIGEIEAGNFQGTWVNEIFSKLSSHWLAGPIFSMIIASLHIVTTVYGYANVSAEKTKQTAAESIRPYLQDLSTLVRMYYRDINNELPVIQEMRKMGISDTKIIDYLDNNRFFLPVDILASLWHRGIITEAEFNQGLKDNSLTETDIQRIKPAFYNYPGMGDLVSFAVREVFSPELASELGLYSDMPDAYLEEAAKAGMKPEYAKMYWAAHWQPVPLSQAFEMFHRQVIDQEQLIDLIRINDYMPNFRQELIDISYSPILRVDLRRMYASGLIDFEQLVKGNMDLGYRREDAELIATWTDEEYVEQEKELAKSDIISLFALGHFSYSEAYEALVSVGHSEYSANDLLLKQELKEAEKEQARVTKLLKKSYLQGTISDGDIRSRLLSTGLPGKAIDDIFRDWDTEKKEKVKYLSVEQLEKILKANIWVHDDVSSYLLKLGYSETDTYALMTLWSLEGENGEEI